MAKKFRLVLLVLMLAMTWTWIPLAQAAETGVVYLVPVSGTIEPGLASFIRHSIAKAEEDKALGLVLVIDTFGGRIDAAIDIKEIILNAKVPIYCYVENKAYSAGALITIAADKIGMKPGSSIGASEPRPAEEKIISTWRSELEATAEARGRDPKIAAAMADKDVEIAGVNKKGKILSLTANQAQKLGFIDYTADNQEEFLAQLGGLDEAEVIELKPGLAEKAARLVTNPYISPILLTIGVLGLIVEALTLGWGIAGIIGLSALGLFFGGHMLAGLTGWESVLLFLLGIIALVLEIFVVPGFGVAGIAGIALIVWSIFLTSISVNQAVISMVFALVGTIIFLALAWKYMTKRHFWDRIILGEKQQNKTGYNSAKKDLDLFVGKTGRAVTPLRPAGTAEIEGTRLDVVTEGDFIPSQAEVKVIYVEGTRVVVKLAAGSSI